MVVNDSFHCEPSTKRRRCLIGEERKLANLSLHGEEEAVVAAEEEAAATTLQPAAITDRKVTTVFIGGLHPRILQAHLEKMCQPYGTIERLHFCDRKGYAFCQYSNTEQAAAAMAALDGRGLLGRRLMVRPAHDQQHNSNGNNNNNNSHTLNNMQNNSNNNSNSNSNSSNPGKERDRIEAKIQTVKRKLQDKQNQP